MFNRQNQRQQSLFYKYTDYMPTIDDNGLLSPKFHNLFYDQDYCPPNNDNLFSNQLQHLASESFRTISRDSIEMVPDLSVMEVVEEKLGVAQKYSNSSIMQVSDDESDSTENQKKLIRQTENLTISNQLQEDQKKQAANLSANESENLRNLGNRKKQKVHIIKQNRKFLNCLKRMNKYNVKIKGKFMLKTEFQSIKMKDGNIVPILSLKGMVSGFILRNKLQQLKIKVSNDCVVTNEPIFELWRQSQQNWEEVKLISKLKFD